MGDPVPFYKYKVIHGPFGIIQADVYYPSPSGTMHDRMLYHYAGPGSVDYIIRREFGTDEATNLQIRYNITYLLWWKCEHIDGTSLVIITDYYTLKWDEVSYGTTSSQKYTFELECSPFNAEE